MLCVYACYIGIIMLVVLFVIYYKHQTRPVSVLHRMYLEKGPLGKFTRLGEFGVSVLIFDLIFLIVTHKGIHVLTHILILITLLGVFNTEYVKTHILQYEMEYNVQKRFSKLINEFVKSHRSLPSRILIYFSTYRGIEILSLLIVVGIYYLQRIFDISLYISPRRYFQDVYYYKGTISCLLSCGYEIITLILYFLGIALYLVFLRQTFLTGYVVTSLAQLFEKGSFGENRLVDSILSTNFCSQKYTIWESDNESNIQLFGLLQIKECLINITELLSTQISIILSVLKRSLAIVVLMLLFVVSRTYDFIYNTSSKESYISIIINSLRDPYLLKQNLNNFGSQGIEVFDGIIIVSLIFFMIVIMLLSIAQTLSMIAKFSSAVIKLLSKISIKIKENTLKNPIEDPLRIFVLLSIVDKHYQEVSSLTRTSLSLSLSTLDIFSFVLLLSTYLITLIPLVHNRLLTILILVAGIGGLIIGGILLIISSSLSTSQ